MGFWDVVYSIGDGVKGITPDLSTVKRAGVGAYHFSSAAVTKIDQEIRVDGIQKLSQYWPDGEARAQVCLFTTTLAKNTAKYAVYEGFKHIPGASVASKLVSETMREVKQKKHKDGMEAIGAKVDRLEKDLKKSDVSQNVNLHTQNAGGGESEKIKDAINVFFMKEFVGNQMFRDLMVPKAKIARVEKEKE